MPPPPRALTALTASTLLRHTLGCPAATAPASCHPPSSSSSLDPPPLRPLQQQAGGVAAPEKEAEKAIVEAEVEKVAATMKKEKIKESTLNLKHTSDNVAREGLGENLPYPGVDCTSS
jgi:hypothetical protein